MCVSRVCERRPADKKRLGGDSWEKLACCCFLFRYHILWLSNADCAGGGKEQPKKSRPPHSLTTSGLNFLSGAHRSLQRNSIQITVRVLATHAATTKQCNKTTRSWTPCVTISATCSKRCGPRQSRRLSLSLPKIKAVGLAGFATSAGPPPPTSTSYDTVGAAPRCTTAASTVPKQTGRRTSSYARVCAGHAFLSRLYTLPFAPACMLCVPQLMCA